MKSKILKVYYKDWCKRTNFDSITSYENLFEKVKELFNFKNQNKFYLKYDGNKIEKNDFLKLKENSNKKTIKLELILEKGNLLLINSKIINENDYIKEKKISSPKNNSLIDSQILVEFDSIIKQRLSNLENLFNNKFEQLINESKLGKNITNLKTNECKYVNLNCTNCNKTIYDIKYECIICKTEQILCQECAESHREHPLIQFYLDANYPGFNTGKEIKNYLYNQFLKKINNNNNNFPLDVKNNNNNNFPLDIKNNNNNNFPLDIKNNNNNNFPLDRKNINNINPNQKLIEQNDAYIIDLSLMNLHKNKIVIPKESMITINLINKSEKNLNEKIELIIEGAKELKITDLSDISQLPSKKEVHGLLGIAAPEKEFNETIKITLVNTKYNLIFEPLEITFYISLKDENEIKKQNIDLYLKDKGINNKINPNDEKSIYDELSKSEFNIKMREKVDNILKNYLKK